MPIVHCVSLPFVRVEYDRSAPNCQSSAVTRAGSVAVAFTSQQHAEWQIGDTRFAGHFPAGVSLPGCSDLIWHRWSETSEAVEFWLDERWLDRLFGVKEAMRRFEPRLHFDDVVFHAVASQFRRVMLSGRIDAMCFEEIALAAGKRLLRNVASIGKREPTAPLDDRHLSRIDEFVAAHLSHTITLKQLAAVLGMSVFHFAKRFRAATSVSPYAWIVAWRMNRAMQLLRHGWSVRKVALAVGYSDSSHFRQQFRAHWQQSPGRLESCAQEK